MLSKIIVTLNSHPNSQHQKGTQQNGEGSKYIKKNIEQNKKKEKKAQKMPISNKRRRSKLPLGTVH